ncbi:MAG: thioredoxin domain-containing protein [bacterium]|nr:thioredoxin domain-containing protein [bacterium]
MKFFALTLALLLPFTLWADPLLDQKDPIVGKINGSVVRLSEIEDKELNELRVQLYEAIEQKFKQKALQELSKSDKDFQARPALKISEKEVKAFYDKNGLSSRGSFEELKGQITQYLMGRAAAEHYEALYARALKLKKLQFFPHQPEVIQVKLPVETAYLWGNEQAKVMLLEFSDYQCPFCSRVQGTMSDLRKQFSKKVLFGYRHFPLQFHNEADEAAIAVECARDQGKFEAYHATLFENQQNQKPDDLIRFAAMVGVADKAKFGQCLEKETYRERVNHDLQQAASIGIRGTPSFLVGRYDAQSKSIQGEVFSGALPKEQIVAVIEKYLKEK